ncbi:MAG: hypothetical protein ACFE8B_11655 [Candidatus Hermodarchaeota archaeon]
MVVNNTSLNVEHNKSTFQLFHQILEVLRKFAENYDKRLNFSKFAQFLKLTPSELEEVVQVLLEFQELFATTFNNYLLTKIIINSQVYLTTEKIQELSFIPHKIKIPKSHINMFNDIIYFFKNVKRGKGFDLNKNSTDLLKNVKELCNYYPYCFQEQKNKLIYPSEFGLRLGELILSYNKSNKNIELIELEGTQIVVDTDE